MEPVIQKKLEATRGVASLTPGTAGTGKARRQVEQRDHDGDKCPRPYRRDAVDSDRIDGGQGEIASAGIALRCLPPGYRPDRVAVYLNAVSHQRPIARPDLHRPPLGNGCPEDAGIASPRRAPDNDNEEPGDGILH